MAASSALFPGFVATALQAVGVTAWELDVASGELQRCGAVGGVAGDRADLEAVGGDLHPDDRVRVNQGLAALIAGTVEEQELECRWGHAGEAWAWYEVRYRAASRDAGGRALRVVGVSRDISRRKSVFGAVEARLRSYISHGGMPVWCLEPETPVPVAAPVEAQIERLLAARLVDCNDAFLAGRGLTRDQAMGSTMAQLATLPHQLQGVVARLVSSHYIHEEEAFDGVSADGQPRHLMVRVKAVIEDGHVVRLWGSTTDRTAQVIAERQREALEAQLRQAQRLESVGALAGGVAHDFNNLLVAIQGSVELAAAALPANTPVAEDLAVIRDATERAADLTRRLLTFSRRQPARREPFTAAEVIHGLTPMLRRLLPASMKIELAVADALPPLIGDASALEQALINLVINARDATRGAGRLRIAADAVTLDEAACHDRPWARPGAYVRLSVADDGSGIPPEHLGRIFDPFFSTKPVDQGTGLGLAIVYGTVVRQHDGLVEVTSSPSGTCFSLYLPRPAVVPAAAASAGSRLAVTPGHERLLLAEDEAAVRRITVALLERSGYRVVAVADGAAAVAAFEHDPDGFDLVVLDAIMPALGGREVYDRIQALRPDQRVLFVSGYTDGELEGVPIDQQRRWFLAKPWNRSELLRAVRTAIDTA